MKSKIKFKTKVEKIEGSRVKIMVSIAQNDFQTLRSRAEQKVLSEVKMDGFRDGKVPMSVFLSKYGEFPIAQEMGYLAVDETYVDVILQEKIEAIGRPEIAIEKLATGASDDFEYSIKVDILPKVELGDYKKYSKKIELEEVKAATDEEINEAVEELRRMRIEKKKIMSKNEAGEEIEKEEETIPELDQEFLKSVGDFKTLEELKNRIKENIESEKKFKAAEKRKGQILDLLVAETKCDIPETMIDNELAKMESRIKGDLAQMGVSFEDYLKHMSGNTEPVEAKRLANWKESQKESAKKQVVIQLALHAISKNENLKVSAETIAHEVAHLMSQYQDIDKERATAYTEEKMTNSLVAEYLFTGKVPDEKELFGSHEDHNH